MLPIPDSPKFNILVVDDEAAIRRILPILFRRAGYLVQTASNGEEARSMVSSSEVHFDVVITDHNMPVLSGDGLVRSLKETGFAGMILVCSAFLTPELKCYYLKLGVRECLSKPVSWEDLRDRVNEFTTDVGS